MPIRNMQIADISEVLLIQNELGFLAWTIDEYKRELNAPYTYAIVYTSDCKILGYAMFHILGEDSELLNIAVSKNAQCRGIGSKLLEAGLLQLDFTKGDCCFLEVRESNNQARRFYENHGFVLFATRKKYYANGENAALYRTDSEE